ncbi:uncharacterized protein LOC133517468 [Cydia pomonella]|uniref:uncharacterized protein LOC133517468 n=1 Tax=Cydia pomonella TaxID=82600 RepID=UPI002ADD6211|nr:uncharacterized protein LOC133517468 [Cydia pomonella]
MKDLGKAALILGMQITQTKDIIKVDQERYIEIKKLLKTFRMEYCKTAATPAAAGCHLKKSDHTPDDRIPYQKYQNLIGSLMYLAVCTRPDITHAVSTLSQFNTFYREEHWIGAKRVLRYLKGTKSRGIVNFKRCSADRFIQGYSDASHGGDEDRKSWTGYTFLAQGAAVCWQSIKQKTIALSTAEAEYVALSEAAREAIFLRMLIAQTPGRTRN